MNYEETAFYGIEVSINDGKFTTIISIAVKIINENEWPPTFLRSGEGPLNVKYLISRICKRLIYDSLKFKADVRSCCTHVNQNINIPSTGLFMP